ncbi:hypothetical protein [Sphingobacterium bovistauri]|uniref:Lipoprotein n=1 Tax=Sphingobacterium bovistauri TaxID=2781959 RepID=A0ABS7Z2P6_9SPHI|nr:hypothetical protein [Sphingobacterium bovistauri]MCA5004444.1 hypothetical protein [Sphingobacterium bovistauri]
MNKIIYILLIIITFLSCSKDDSEYENEYEKSYKTWQQFSKTNNQTYSYTTQLTSWVGTTIHTKITIENNQITKREFKYFRIGSKTIPESGWTKQLAIEALKEIGIKEDEIQSSYGTEVIDKLQWVENKENLGNHGSENELMTLEQIYNKTKNEWIVKRPKSTIYFETKNNGLISTAGYVPQGCVDDCFRGINIIKIENLED